MCKIAPMTEQTAQQTHKTNTPPAWHQQAIPLLGKKPDTQVARMVGVSLRQVCYLRKKLKIKAACRGRWQDPEVLRFLGVKKDKELAQEIGVDTETVRKRRAKLERKHERWGMPPEALPLLGKITDAEMAAKFGRAIETVRIWRNKHKIAAVRQRRVWKKNELSMLGCMPDTIVSRLLGRRIEDVRKKRLSLRIGEYIA